MGTSAALASPETRLHIIGATIHRATFYGQAGAAYGCMAKGWGEQEEYMLKSVSERMIRYLVKNYEEPYGGPVSY